jgi:hypothetical protein
MPTILSLPDPILMTRTLELAALHAGEIMVGVVRDRAAAD